MATMLPSSARRWLCQNALGRPHAAQRRWARVHDIRLMATQPPSERIFDKYRDKLDAKAREMGAGNVDDLKRLVRQRASRPSGPLSAYGPPPPPPEPVPSASSSPSSSSGSSSPPTSRSTSASSASSASSAPPGIKLLSSFVDVEKFKSLPPKELATLWRLRHASSSSSLCASMPISVYRQIEATARRHPQFILPLAQPVPETDSPATAASSISDEAGGQPQVAAEIHFLQWTFPTPDTSTVLFTHLAEYKARGEYAQPHTTVTHHLDLADSNQVVLLQGQVVPDRGVSVEAAQALLLGLQKFYGGIGEPTAREQRQELLEMFSRGDPAFKVERVVDEVEKIL